MVFTQPIPLLLDSGHLKEPEQLTCRIPMNLAPINLAYHKKLTGDVSLTITWDDPPAKRPEEGFKIVVSPYDDARYTRPVLYHVGPEDENMLSLDGMQYDPFMEYSCLLYTSPSPRD